MSGSEVVDMRLYFPDVWSNDNILDGSEEEYDHGFSEEKSLELAYMSYILYFHFDMTALLY